MYVTVISRTRFRLNPLSKLRVTEFQETPLLKQALYQNFKWQQPDSNPQQLRIILYHFIAGKDIS